MLSLEEDEKLFYDYEALLQRLYQKVPKPASSGERFELPKFQLHYVGNQTVVRNFREVADLLRRDPEMLQRYLLRELATAGNYDFHSGILTIGTKISSSTLSQILERFVANYLICPTCGRPDTRIIKKGKTWILKCDACGAEQPVKPF